MPIDRVVEFAQSIIVKAYWALHSSLFMGDAAAQIALVHGQKFWLHRSFIQDGQFLANPFVIYYYFELVLLYKRVLGMWRVKTHKLAACASIVSVPHKIHRVLHPGPSMKRLSCLMLRHQACSWENILFVTLHGSAIHSSWFMWDWSCVLSLADPSQLPWVDQVTSGLGPR